MFSGRVTQVTWRSRPSWSAVSRNYRTVELDAGHLSLISHPDAIVRLILQAAGREG